jgi:hypothetical protein
MKTGIDWQDYIRRAGYDMIAFLIDKNVAYGNSIFEPIRKFSNADVVEQINVRIDDKLNRIFQGEEYPGDDTLKDLAGYYILKRAYEMAMGEKNE